MQVYEVVGRFLLTAVEMPDTINFMKSKPLVINSLLQASPANPVFAQIADGHGCLYLYRWMSSPFRSMLASFCLEWSLAIGLHVENSSSCALKQNRHVSSHGSALTQP